jgi:hypothetical protein
MRQICLDLPFEAVGELLAFSGSRCDYNQESDPDKRWLLIHANQSVELNRGIDEYGRRSQVWIGVKPEHFFAFTVFVGDGCESLDIGLCQYPATVRHEGRSIPTKLGGRWRWRSFCKTQYANDPRCGGMANFLRCHISTITALERIGQLQSVKVEINDEGKYGPSNYSDDWEEARKAGRKPTYTWHEGKYDPHALAQEVGKWDEMIAGMVGGMNDAFGEEGQSSMQGRPDFERLEHQGRLKHDDERLPSFLQTLSEVAKRIAAESSSA